MLITLVGSLGMTFPFGAGPEIGRSVTHAETHTAKEAPRPAPATPAPVVTAVRGTGA